ncbi:MAG TPA: right-handed parallel beta-helix repeat-containing protein [Tepidisphaeraceae bacterium]|nr:right-handed parallel beta-helix repeat-containing protein [Tepidisphaeraceae bacterium]
MNLRNIGVSMVVALCSLMMSSCDLARLASPTTKPAAIARFTAIAPLIKRGAHVLRLPAGQYQLGPGTVEIPADFQLVGAGPATVIHLVPGTKLALRLGRGARLSQLRFDCQGVVAGSVGDFLILVPPGVSGVTLDNLEILDCPRTAIGLDHAADAVIRHCRFQRIAMAMNVLFSRNVRVEDNTVIDAKIHGVEFWGNWHWKQQVADNLLFSGNTVLNGGNCCIWGSGGRHVIISNNFVDGAKDIGLDLEWCSDSVISSNIARRCRNAGIALFFACRNVAITGNSVANDAAISAKDAKADWWVRSGIWLTYPNRKTFGSDHGHENITIVGNAITCAPGHRRAIWVGSEVRNVVIASNAIVGGQVWFGGHDGEHPMRLKLEPSNVVLGTECPLPSATTQPTSSP